MVKFSLILVLLLSCSHHNGKDTSVSSQWRGKFQDELLEHPYFKNLKVIKTQSQQRSQWRYIDQTPFQTGAYCQSLGGCLGLPSYNCQYQFNLKGIVIEEFEMSGVCPPRKTIEPL